jgi:hypothetical protein
LESPNPSPEKFPMNLSAVRVFAKIVCAERPLGNKLGAFNENARFVSRRGPQKRLDVSAVATLIFSALALTNCVVEAKAEFATIGLLLIKTDFVFTLHDTISVEAVNATEGEDVVI